MLNQAVQFLLGTFINLFVFAVLLRFYMQVMRAPFRNPFAQFIVALTDFAVRPLRKLIPGLWGLDLSCLFLALVAEFLLVVAVQWLNGFPFMVAPGAAYLGLLLLTVAKLLKLSLYLLIAVVFAQAVLSWVNPFNPLQPVLTALSRPFTRFFQRIIPPIANVDLSPLFVFIAAELVLMLPVTWLEVLAFRLI
ncbi:MAG: YggT family protein [Betaproteobacteria bacterium]|nr:YggT family protein [Betaproteobacteria bacterium]